MVHFSKGGLRGLYQEEPIQNYLDLLQCSDLCWDVFIYLIHTVLAVVLERLSSGPGQEDWW